MWFTYVHLALSVNFFSQVRVSCSNAFNLFGNHSNARCKPSINTAILKIGHCPEKQAAGWVEAAAFRCLMFRPADTMGLFQVNFRVNKIEKNFRAFPESALRVRSHAIGCWDVRNYFEATTGERTSSSGDVCQPSTADCESHRDRAFAPLREEAETTI